MYNLAHNSASLHMPIPQQSSPVEDDRTVQYPTLVEHSSEVTYFEELMAEHPSANIAFMGSQMSVPAVQESMSMEDESSTPVHECQDETPFQQESQAGAELPATMPMSKNDIFPVKAEGSIVTGTYICKHVYFIHKAYINSGTVCTSIALWYASHTMS